MVLSASPCYTVSMLTSGNKRLVRLMLGNILGIFAVNTLAIFFYLYNALWWFDMPMHFWGGAWLMIAVLASRLWIRPEGGVGDPMLVTRHTFFIALLLVFAIGAAWEGFEYIVQYYTGAGLANPLDSMSDMAFDMSGALFAWLYLHTKKIIVWKQD